MHAGAANRLAFVRAIESASRLVKNSFFLLAGISSLLLGGCGTTETATMPLSNNSGYVSQREVKVINGKRYVFVPGELGSNIPGRWVPEDSPAAQLPSATREVSRSTIQEIQGGYR
jgi:hypothetical protein